MIDSTDVYAGHKINAIKVIRDLACEYPKMVPYVGLKDAKDFIETAPMHYAFAFCALSTMYMELKRESLTEKIDREITRLEQKVYNDQELIRSSMDDPFDSSLSQLRTDLDHYRETVVKLKELKMSRDKLQNIKDFVDSI